MEGRAYRRADAPPRRDPGGDGAGGSRRAAAAPERRVPACAALPDCAARVFGRLADPVPPSLARLAAVSAAQHRATAHRAVLFYPGRGVGPPPRRVAPERGPSHKRKRPAGSPQGVETIARAPRDGGGFSYASTIDPAAIGCLATS